MHKALKDFLAKHSNGRLATPQEHEDFGSFVVLGARPNPKPKAKSKKKDSQKTLPSIAKMSIEGVKKLREKGLPLPD